MLLLFGRVPCVIKSEPLPRETVEILFVKILAQMEMETAEKRVS